MKVEILPSIAKGKMTAPPSKSMGHRLLISAGLSKGESIVHGIAPSEDMYATLDCLSALGAKIKHEDGTVYIKGIDLCNVPDRPVLACRECGTTLRFFVPIALLLGKTVTFTGSPRLMSRPMDVYTELCAEKGFYYDQTADGITVRGRLCAGEYRIRGDISSQFISGLVFALACAKGKSRIIIKEPFESRPYVDMTLEALREFGIDADFTDDHTIEVIGGEYIARECNVEGDWSNAAFFEALNYLGAALSVDGLREDSLQGDKAYKEIFEKIKAGGAVIDISDCPDLAPIAMALAAEFGGAELVGTSRLKIKESDRGEAMAKELCKFGCRCEIGENNIRVCAARLHAPTEALSSHNDHRIAMALSVLATKYRGIIDGAEAVKKSLPDFFERLEKLGIKISWNG